MTAARTPFRVHAVTASSTIADGNYGAGKVIVWDRGTYTREKGTGEWTEYTCSIPVASHEMRIPGLQPDTEYEYQAGAILEYFFKRDGSPRNGFSSILGSGPNATVLHYQKNMK